MTDDAKTQDIATLKTELDQALSTLDLALLEAGRSVTVVRNNMNAVIELAQRADDMQAAIARAREQLSVASEPANGPALRALPPTEPAASEPEAIEPAASEPTTTEATSTEPVLEPEAETETDAPTAEEPAEETSSIEEASPAPVQTLSETSRCLRLGVVSKSGNLDLKEVDGSVNENPSVIDVALLDYDGRQATLKLWINDSSDPNGVREALMSSLRNHLGEDETELTVDFEEDTAA